MSISEGFKSRTDRWASLSLWVGVLYVSSPSLSCHLFVISAESSGARGNGSADTVNAGSESWSEDEDEAKNASWETCGDYTDLECIEKRKSSANGYSYCNTASAFGLFLHK